MRLDQGMFCLQGGTMSEKRDESTDFMHTLFSQWQDQIDNGTDHYKRMAVAYRDFLDRQLTNENFDKVEREWAQMMTSMLLDSMKCQREARARFIHSQRTMLDQYIEYLERMGNKSDSD
jgi:hypothetical protein